MTSDFAFVDQVWRRGLKPQVPLSVSDWAERHRILPSTSAEPGPWRNSRTPYLKAIMDALSESSPFERVVVMAGTQVGKTEVGLNWIGYIVDHAPGLALMVMPSLDMVKRNVKTRLDPMFESTPALRNLIGPAKSKDGSNSMFLKEFPGGQLVMTGANSGSALRSTPARLLFLDEVDAYPGDVDGEGDPVDLVTRRTTTFRSRRKIYMVSTPTVKDHSRIEAAYEESNKQKLFVPCPQCGSFAPITWARIRWENDNPRGAHLVCEECGGIAEEHDKPAMLAKAEWRAQSDGDGKTAGFHLPSLYSPFETWANIAVEHGQVKNDPSRLKTWVNSVLAETWRDVTGDEISNADLSARREPWTGRVPMGVCVLTAGVDIQDDRLEVQVIGYGLGEEAWPVAYHIIPGDPSGPRPWQELDDYLLTTFEHEKDGFSLSIAATCVDTGGHHTRSAYEFTRIRHARRIWAIKGANFTSTPAWPRKPSYQNKGSVPLYVIGVDALKDTISSRLQVTEPGPGCIHFPATFGEDYFSQLTSEHRITKFVKGRPKRTWQPKKSGLRNEALDTFVYSLAALTGLLSLGFSLENEAALIKASAIPSNQNSPRVHRSKFMQR